MAILISKLKGPNEFSVLANKKLKRITIHPGANEIDSKDLEILSSDETFKAMMEKGVLIQGEKVSKKKDSTTGLKDSKE